MAAAPTVCVRRAKLTWLMERAGQDVLTFVLKRGALNPPTAPPGVSLADYLDHLPAGSTANYGKMNNSQKRRELNATDRRQLQRYPLWDKFDVTLLFKAIKLTCEGVAGMNDPAWQDQSVLEGMVTEIKNKRNELIHETRYLSEREYQHQVNELEALFTRLLSAAKTKYRISDGDMTAVEGRVRQATHDFRKAGMEKEILIDYFNDMHQEFLRDCKSSLDAFNDKFQTIDPFVFLTNLPTQRFHIQDIFCQMSLKEGRGHAQQSRDIDVNDVLTVTRRAAQTPQPCTSSSAPRRAKPQLVLIEGVAGSGKTTLLAYLLSQWLQGPAACSVKHLHEHDILVRVVCRNNDGPLLKDFLKQDLPHHYGVLDDHIVPCLKKFKVILLIDGLDELSPGSPAEQLVTDILSTAEHSPDFTLVCTSRPEVAQDFLSKVPDGIDVWCVEMKGVSEEQRTPFVMKYYEQLPDNGNKDPDRLKLYMESVGWREMYGLPLNLLFLTRIIYDDPDKISIASSETSIYITIRDWCIEKLQNRLSTPRDRRRRHVCISEVLQAMYSMALQALLQGRVTLSRHEEQRVRTACDKRGLLSQELLPAFFNLRDVSDRQGRRQQVYTAPHKSLQEFYAASRIVHKLKHSSDIRDMLDNPPPTQLRNLRNLLQHVAGLLCHQETPPYAAAIQEVMYLLAETGVQDCNDWLSVLGDTKVNQIALDCIASLVTSDESEEVLIVDENISAATALLPRIPTKTVWIWLTRKESDVQAPLCARHTYIKLSLWRQYEQPDQATASDSWLRATPRMNLQKFTGRLSVVGTQLLQQCQALTLLHLAVCDNDAQEVLAAIRTVVPSLPQLYYFSLHVPMGAMRSLAHSTVLPPCPRIEGGEVHLVLSGVDETLLDQASHMARQLRPTDPSTQRPYRYWGIRFPGSRMTADVWRRFLQKLAAAGVGAQVRGVEVPDTSPITKQEEQQLNSLAKTTTLHEFIRKPEERMWV